MIIYNTLDDLKLHHTSCISCLSVIGYHLVITQYTNTPHRKQHKINELNNIATFHMGLDRILKNKNKKWKN